MNHAPLIAVFGRDQSKVVLYRLAADVAVHGRMGSENL
jgi:hypothetical protein